MNAIVFPIDHLVSTRDISLQDKLESFSNFKLSNSGVGRLSQIGLFHESFGLNLSELELRLLGKTIENKLQLNFQHTLIPEINTILMTAFRKQLPNLEDFENYKISNEVELISRLLGDRMPSGFDRTTKKEINDFRNSSHNIRELVDTPVDLYLFSGEDLGISGLKYVLLRKKTPKSFYTKIAHKASSILAPTVRELKEFSGSMGLTSTNNLTKISLDILLEMHSSGENLFDYIDLFTPSENPVNFPDYRHNKKKTYLGGKFNDILTDLNLIDGCGVIFAVSNKDVGNRMGRIINQHYNSDLIDGKTEHLLNTGEKDASNVWGIRGNTLGTYFEARLQLVGDLIAGKLGSEKLRAHHRYDYATFVSLRNKLNSSKPFRSYVKNVEMMAGIEEDSFLKTNWVYK